MTTAALTLKDQPTQLIKRAAALKFKYRKGQKIRIPPCLVGFHHQNRGGAKLSGLRVLELTFDLLKKGCDEEEADCGNVVIETAMVMAYNVDSCAGDPWLCATVEGKQLQFGTIAGSHLNQVLKNISAGISFASAEDPPEELTKLLDTTGKMQFDLLRTYDETLAKYVAEGLLFEVLDPAI